jgi:hypothetical protein
MVLSDKIKDGYIASQALVFNANIIRLENQR